MAILLNRKYGSRLECLYYILKSCYAKYGATQLFNLNNLKFDLEDEHNVHEYCQLTTDLLGIKCCPFLVNPLDSSKCYATQSVESDSTKSKAVSDIGGSLEALGFVERIGARQYRITQEGAQWVHSDFFTAEWEDIARKGVLSYGLAIGFLAVIRDLPEIFSSAPIYLGYPLTEETVLYQDDHGNTHVVELSTGSERDSVTRTKSRILGWCISVGLIEPVDKNANFGHSLAHLRYRSFLNQKGLTTRKFKKTPLYNSIFLSKRHVANPLSYDRLHKDVRALRENGGEILREATMHHNPKIINRRFVFTYVLNVCSKQNKDLDFEALVECMKPYGEYFFTPNNDAYAIMSTESQIADFAGIPFDEVNGKLRPLTTIDEGILCENAPAEIVRLAKRIVSKMGLTL